jgi:E3 ubiquitin-protein ligase RAD18
MKRCDEVDPRPRESAPQKLTLSNPAGASSRSKQFAKPAAASTMSSKNDADITDSTDWLNTSLSSFAPLESALRCQVCKEFYDTPMITSCSHTFCSICIRRCLSSDGKCPTCRADDQASKLRRNWTVQELADAFQSARPVALELAKKDQEAREADQGSKKRKRKLADTDMAQDDLVKQSRTRQTRSSTRREGSTSAQSSQNVVVLDSEGEGEEDYAPERKTRMEQPADGLVACPMCSQRMKEELVFPHIDSCTGEPEPERKPAKIQLAFT